MLSMLTSPGTCEVSSRAEFFVFSFVLKSLLVKLDNIVLVVWRCFFIVKNFAFY